MTATTTIIRTAFTAALNDHAAYSSAVTDAMATLEVDVAAAVQKVLAIVDARDTTIRDLIAQAIGVVPTRDADATGAAPDVYVNTVSGLSGATIVVDGDSLGYGHGAVSTTSVRTAVITATDRALAGSLR